MGHESCARGQAEAIHFVPLSALPYAEVPRATARRQRRGTGAAAFVLAAIAAALVLAAPEEKRAPSVQSDRPSDIVASPPRPERSFARRPRLERAARTR